MLVDSLFGVLRVENTSMRLEMSMKCKQCQNVHPN